jgi:GWxTD domain-containing protein
VLPALAAVMASLLGAVSAAPAVQDDYPTAAGEARRFYESRIDNWTDGPAEMLLTNEEREIWDNLEDTAQRERFIQWFWDRRDPDGRMIGNKYQEDFYDRVAYCNTRYRGFPRGWKSDRGRVRLVLGDPDIVSRQTYSQLTGVPGNGPDFEIWSYSNLGNNRAFQASGGEFLVYFAETRIGSYEVWDFNWGPGVWDRNIRLAFEISIEASIIDPITEFEAGEARGDFVREISEGSLPAEIPIGIWADLGAGGMISVPVQIRLGDLLFQPEGDQYVAHLEADLSLDPPGGSAGTLRVPWEIRLSESDLLALGNGSFVTAITKQAAAGSTEASLSVSHPLAATSAEWSQTVVVGADPGTAIVVGETALPLSADDDTQVAVLMSADGVFDSGGTMVVGAWMRGATPSPDAVSIQLEAAGGSYALEIEEATWRGGLAGPLIARARIPEIDAGEYQLRVDFGAGLPAATTTVQLAR